MQQAKVSAGSVNVRSGPSTKERRLGALKKGDTFSYSSDQDGWLQTTYKNQTAYICKQFTTTSENTNAQSETQSQTQTNDNSDSNTESKVRINTNKVNIRKGPSKKNGTYGQANKGDEFTLYGSVDADWYKIDYKGNVAYVMKQFADKVNSEQTQQQQQQQQQTESTGWNGEKPLSQSKEDAAVSYSENSNLSTIWKEIQKLVGVEPTGVIDGKTVQAIAVWQKENDLTPDGKFGSKSQAKANLYPQSSSDDTDSPDVQQTNQDTLKAVSNDYVRRYAGGSGRHVKQLVEMNSGKRFDISWAAPSTDYHSDVTPNDKSSTDVVKNIVNPSKATDDYAYWSRGSAWDWRGYPGAMQLSNGVWIACGFHLRPHGAPQGGHPDNPWNQTSPKSRPTGYSSQTKEGKDVWKPGGHFCLYYSRENRGGTDSCRDAFDKAKRMKVPT